MTWRKKGLVYAPKGDLWWARNYALLPTAEVIDDHVIRVYFASLDDNQYGRIGYVDLDADEPKRILFETQEPVLDLGELGAFDDSGVTPSCILNFGGKKYLYYIGWQRCERVPYMLFTGLAVSDDEGQSFAKHSPVPVLDRTPREPFSRSAPFVLIENNVLGMWYWSCESWSLEEGVVHYNNVIRYAESEDGILWHGTDDICIVPEGNGDYSVGRPWVVRDADTYRMWYSIRSGTAPYRMGYAESRDGINWERRDTEVGIQRSESGWDHEMICYPCVIDVKDRRYMFYNGNRHGWTGFGYAVQETA